MEEGGEHNARVGECGGELWNALSWAGSGNSTHDLMAAVTLCRRLPQAHANQKTGHQWALQQAPPKGLDDSKQNKPNKQVKNQDTKEGKRGIFSGVLVKWEVGLGIEVVGVYVYEMIKV